jgi:hypothetical protein
LDKYFPYFVWERLVPDLIVFNFQNEGQSLQEYIEQVFRAANFLRYDSSEQQLVDRIVMNFYPSILAHAAFLDRPRFHEELHKVVGLIKEKSAIANEWQRGQESAHLLKSSKVVTWNVLCIAQVQSGGSASVSSRCWSCGQLGHFR